MIYSPLTKIFDWISAFYSFLLAPILVVSSLYGLTFFVDDLTWNIAIVGSLLTIIFLIIFKYYIKNYHLLKGFAIDTAYVHFKPSYKDLILALYGQIFTILLILVVLLFLFIGIISSSSTRELFLFSAGLSILIQLIQTIIINKSKIRLINTAQEPVSAELLQRMYKKTSDISKIKKFYFADIKPASLFLSAGVTDYSFKSHICLVSRYFQWKLSEDELLAVIGHEIGHVVHKDMLQSKFLLNLQTFSRVFLFYYLFNLLKNTSSSVAIQPELFITYLCLVTLTIFIQVFTSFSLQLRMFNQEILADNYGASLMGNYSLAKTLKKLPSIIPAPVDDNPLQFLGFRIAILNNRAKKLGEEETNTREFSRYSNN